MAQEVFSLPVSVEQIAAVIKQMSPAERQRLFELVPEIHHQLVGGKLRSTEAMDATVERLRAEMKGRLGAAMIFDDMPFLGGLTLRQYSDLAENERARLWEADLDEHFLEVPNAQWPAAKEIAP